MTKLKAIKTYYGHALSRTKGSEYVLISDLVWLVERAEDASEVRTLKREINRLAEANRKLTEAHLATMSRGFRDAGFSFRTSYDAVCGKEVDSSLVEDVERGRELLEELSTEGESVYV